MSHPLYVAIVWHMHQPYYVDLDTGLLTLPWVRLHATKDYLHMAEVVQEYPEIHVTFNMVPSLTEQLDLYARNQAMDKSLQLSRQDSWSLEDRQFLLSMFFDINWNKVIRKYPAYRRLLQLRQAAPDSPELFSAQYYRDLIAWFNLAWIDPNWLERDHRLAALVAKGKNFSRDDIALILRKQSEIVGRVLPTLRRMSDANQIEITTSPYYHPILPLLINTESARRASPDLPLPSPGFAHPEDADKQIRRAVESHEHYFGKAPAGMWPSEGSVCPEMIERLARHGFAWFASDEIILGRSLATTIERDGFGQVRDPAVLYQPYRAADTPGAPTIIFRDHFLSDRIGFVYQHMGAKDAVDDLLYRLYAIRDRLGDSDVPYLVPIILDGENCWEEYEHNGDLFLRRLYERLSKEKRYLRSVTVSEYLSRFPARQSLECLATGSWIGGNFETWIGEPAQNQAWEYLTRAREHLTVRQAEPSAPDPESLRQAWEAMYVTEGSDWFWWYYSRNNPASENLFDRDFRHQLEHVYQFSGTPIPAWLKVPITLEPTAAPRTRMPSGPVKPPMDAAEALPPEWQQAGYLDPAPAGGAMQRATTFLKRLYFGSNETDLVLRVESNQDFSAHAVSVYLSMLDGLASNRLVRFPESNPTLEFPQIDLDWEMRVSETEATLYRAQGEERWAAVAAPTRVARGARVREIDIPLDSLGLRPGQTIALFVLLYQDDAVVEILPSSGYVSFVLSG